ncbi:MAG: TPM domain-containing protein [Bacteroidetes bacterium]|nr:TPM domain-containing protein [Bacteroidota bacterium]
MGTTARDFFSPEQQKAITKAIADAELQTSGEIRVHIENTLKGDVLDRAAYLFRQLGMNKTQLRNGVLIYLAVRSRQFAILGDKGIHKAVPENFWDNIKHGMLLDFSDNIFTEGLITAISAAVEQLKKHFPHLDNDKNELSDDISFGKN